MCDHNWVLILTSDFMPTGRRSCIAFVNKWRADCVKMCLTCHTIKIKTDGFGWLISVPVEFVPSFIIALKTVGDQVYQYNTVEDL